MVSSKAFVSALFVFTLTAVSCTGLKDDVPEDEGDASRAISRDGGPRDAGVSRGKRDSGTGRGDRDADPSAGGPGEDSGGPASADDAGDAASEPMMDADTPVDSGNPMSDAMVDSGGAGSGGSGGSGEPQPVCSAADNGCAGDMLKICKNDGSGFDMTPCAVGCSITPAPHCTQLQPSAPVTAEDLSANGLVAVTLTAAGDTLLNTDTGAISGAVTRAANTVNTRREVSSGIAFHQTADGHGVFSFASLTVGSSATLKLIGSRAGTLVSAANLVVHGTIEARPMDVSGALCPAERVAGPGGGLGGTKSMLICCPMPISGENGAGPGGGGGAARNAIMGSPGGGGGAGHAAAGGKGGGSCSQNQPTDNGGVAGASYTTGQSNL